MKDITQLDPVALRTLAVAVRLGTFEAAARELHVTPSAVSQRIKALETRIGRVLLHRVKPLEPTEAGLVLVRLATQTGAPRAGGGRRAGRGGPTATGRRTPPCRSR